jgi:hypothetical protein
MKISNLTEEQINSFPTYVDKFVKIGLDTSPFNKEKALEAVKLAYECANLTPPKDYLFFKSPLVGSLIVKKILNSKNVIAPFYGSFESSYFSYSTFYRDNGFVEETKPLSGLFKCIEECGWVWFFDNLCIITEKPIFISRNENGELHNLAGPAIKYSDGYSLYFINGKPINEKYFKRISFYLNNRKNIIKNRFSLEQELIKQLINNQVYHQVNNQVNNQVSYQVNSKVYNQVNNQVSYQVNNEVRNQVYYQVYHQVSNPVLNQVYNQVLNQVNSKVFHQVSNQVYNQVSYQVYNQVFHQALKL